MNKKIFVLDTSVLLYSASSIRSFGSKDVVIPYVVLEELDTFKTRDGSVGANSRQVARELNELRHQGPINEGVVVTPKGGKIRVEFGYHGKGHNHPEIKTNDDRILYVCQCLGEKGNDVVLVTKDINLAVRADVLGVTAQDFDTDKLVNSASDIYSGTCNLVVEDVIIEDFYSGEDIFIEELGIEPYPNQYLTLVSSSNGNKTALAKVNEQNKPLSKLRTKGAWGISSRNKEQTFAMDALMDPSICLVTLTGKAGTGKTLVALACALQQVSEDASFSRLVVSRPVQPMGRDIGFLPGDANEKLDPWMGPIKDTLEFLTRGKSKNQDRTMYDQMIDMGIIEVEPLTYIRGRSMPNVFFIVDEAQDLSAQEVKTIVSRMGEGSKIVLIGDIMQLTNPYLDATNNGLSKVIESFKPYPFAAHVTLTKGERSLLATVASEIL